MFRVLFPAPFPDAARQRQFAALAAVLDAAGEPGVLLGNAASFTPVAADALLVRPEGAVLLTLGGTGGHLTVPADPTAAWLLAGEPMQAADGEANPLLAFERQLGPAQRWLSEQLGRPGAALPPTRGLALFESPLSFAPEVEARLDAVGVDFELLDDVRRLPARLRQPPLAAGQRLAPGALLAWADHLAATLGGALPDLALPSADPADFADLLNPAGPADPPAAWLRRHLRQLWLWLGAEDVPADPPYGGSAYAPGPALAALAAQEAHLRQLRHELQAELLAQRQQAAAHETAHAAAQEAAQEAAHARELRLLREQLRAAEVFPATALPNPAAAPASAQPLTQLTTQAVEQAASWRAAQAELAARNAELDGRIAQLSHLIGQLRAAPTAGAAVGLPTDAAPSAPNQLPAPPTAAPRHLRQRPWPLVGRLSLAGLAVAALGAGIWQVGRLAPKPDGPAAGFGPHRLVTDSTSAEPDLTANPLMGDTTINIRNPDVLTTDSAVSPAAPPPAEPVAAPTRPPADSTAPAPVAAPPSPDSSARPAP